MHLGIPVKLRMFVKPTTGPYPGEPCATTRCISEVIFGHPFWDCFGHPFWDCFTRIHSSLYACICIYEYVHMYVYIMYIYIYTYVYVIMCFDGKSSFIDVYTVYHTYPHVNPCAYPQPID